MAIAFFWELSNHKKFKWTQADEKWLKDLITAIEKKYATNKPKVL